MCELESAENVWFGILVLYDLWKRRLFCRPLLRDGVDAGTPTAGIVNSVLGSFERGTQIHSLRVPAPTFADAFVQLNASNYLART